MNLKVIDTDGEPVKAFCIANINGDGDVEILNPDGTVARVIHQEAFSEKFRRIAKRGRKE